MAILMLVAKQLQLMLGHPVQTCTMYAQARQSPSTPRALGKLVWQLLWTNRLQLNVLRFGETVDYFELPEDLFFFLN